MTDALPAALAGSVSPTESALAEIEDRIVGLGEAVNAGPEAVARIVEPVRADLRSLLDGVSSLEASLVALGEGPSSEAMLREGFDRVLAAVVARPPVEVPPEVREVKRALEGLELAMTERDRSEAGLFESVITRLERRIDEVGRSVRTTVETAASSPDEVTRAAMSRIERAVTAQRPSDSSTVKALGEIDQTLGRLAQAQAEDLERVLDAVEGRTDTPDLTPVAAQLERNAIRLERAIDALRSAPAPVAPPTTPSGAGNGEVLERLEMLGAQIDGLRRRIALRGRSTPALDDAAIEALSRAVAGRVAALIAPPANGASVARRASVAEE
jgi:hypothetical protein